MNFIGQTKSFPGPYGNLGPKHGYSNNVLQNYHLSVIKLNSESSQIYFDYFYHQENLRLPIIYEKNVQKNESHNLSFNLENDLSEIHIKTNLDFQIGDLAINDHNINYYTFWSDINTTRILNQHISVKIVNKHKRNYFELESNTFLRNTQNNFGLNLCYKKSKNELEYGIRVLNKDIFNFFNYKYKKDDIEIKFYHKPKSFFNMKDPFQDSISFSSNLINFNGINFNLKKSYGEFNFLVNFNYLQYSLNQKFKYLRSSYQLAHGKYKINLISLNSIQNIVSQNFYNLKLNFTPRVYDKRFDFIENIPLIGLLFWNPKKRYKPFIDIDLSYFDWIESGFNEIGNYKLDKLNEPQIYWNYKFGFTIDNFHFSWNHKYLSNSYLYFSNVDSNDIPIHPVGSMSYIQIDWRFND